MRRFTGVDRGWPLRRPVAVTTAMLPLGTPTCTSVFSTALATFMPPPSVYVFATVPFSLRSATSCVTELAVVAFHAYGVEACHHRTADPVGSAEPWLHRDLELHR